MAWYLDVRFDAAMLLNFQDVREVHSHVEEFDGSKSPNGICGCCFVRRKSC